MNRDLQLSDEEFRELDLLVKQALHGTEVELHHTVTFAYKDRVKQRMRLLEQILAKMEEAMPAEEMMQEPRRRTVAA